MANFKKFGHFLTALGHEKTHLAILYNLTIFLAIFWFVTVK